MGLMTAFTSILFCDELTNPTYSLLLPSSILQHTLYIYLYAICHI